MATLDPALARTYWRALLDNASRLVQDAHLLLDAGSVGRARALTVLAEEELGKATGVYDWFSHSWTECSTEPAELPHLGSRDHLAKYRAVYEFGRELEVFWGRGYEGLFPTDDNDWERWRKEREAEAAAAAREANRQKQRGFYVDLTDDGVQEPSAMEPEGGEESLVRAAQVIEMMLIKDHTRMQDGDPEHFDSTHEMQWRVMPTAHAEDYAAFIDSARERSAGDRRAAAPDDDLDETPQ